MNKFETTNNIKKKYCRLII